MMLVVAASDGGEIIDGYDNRIDNNGRKKY
jgi:hypothetical protein